MRRRFDPTRRNASCPRRLAGIARRGWLLGILTGVLLSSTTASSDVVDHADNQTLAAGIGGLGGTSLSATVAAIFLPWPLDGVADGVAIGADVGLKHLPAVFEEPADRTFNPVGCTQPLSVPSQRFAQYDNIFGIPIAPVREDWGDLGSLDVPLFHFNTGVVFTVSHPELIRQTGPVVEMPAGEHQITWTAHTLFDPFWDLALPLALTALPGGSESRGGEAVAAQTGKVSDEVIEVAELARRWFADKLGLVAKKCTTGAGVNACANTLATGVEVGASQAADALDIAQSETITRMHRRTQSIIVYDDEQPTMHIDVPLIELEGTDPGGVRLDRVLPDGVTARNLLRNSVSATDTCGRTASYGTSQPLPALIPLGEHIIEWKSFDLGPALPGTGELGRNVHTATQTVMVTDRQAPILVPPRGLVIEVPSMVITKPRDEIDLGGAQAVDLVDLEPIVRADPPDFFNVNERTVVTWSATDDGFPTPNTSTAEQLVTIKTIGTNTAPMIVDRNLGGSCTMDPAEAPGIGCVRTAETVDIVLSGIDVDELAYANDPSRITSDPLSFSILDQPDHGGFEAPLLPYFIEDFRSAAAGPYTDLVDRKGVSFANTNNQNNWMQDVVCAQTPGPDNDKIRRDWVYGPKFIKVLDDGTYFMIDEGWQCNAGNAGTRPRISKWNADDEMIGETNYTGTNNAFVLDDDGFIYSFILTSSGNSSSFFVQQQVSNLEELNRFAYTFLDTWDFDSSSTTNPDTGVSHFSQASDFVYAKIDSKNGLLFLTDQTNVFVFDVREDLADPEANSNTRSQMRFRYLGALNDGVDFLCLSGGYGSDWTGFAMELDSESNLYIADSCRDRIHKFTPTTFDAAGDIQFGEYVGWLGRCVANGGAGEATSNACDVEKERSRGYSCTDALCPVAASEAASRGSGPGQLDEPVFLAIDQNDTLYVADQGRVQRFLPSGAFGGEAKSTGTGINQGTQPGFVLGNLGSVKTVSVNSTNFFVVDQQESFVHVFETTPLKDLTDSSATVTYVSDEGFYDRADSFTYRASDGLASSDERTVSIQVSRNFRPPVAFSPQTFTIDEDTSVTMPLTGDDPDGVIGTDDIFPLDTLTFRIVDQPAHGTVTGTGAARTYAPDPEYFGPDSFTYVANDGVFDSEPATVTIDVRYVDDPVRISNIDLPERVAAGFPITMRADYNDDGAENDHFATIFWGFDAGEAIDQSHLSDGFVEGDNPATAAVEDAYLDGIALFQPAQGDGAGNLVSQYTYTEPGPRLVEVYVGTVPGPSPAGTFTTRSTVDFMVEHVAALSIKARTALVDAMTADVTVTVENLQPVGIAGLNATDVQLVMTDEPVTVIAMSSNTPGCSLSAGKVSCSRASMAPGERFEFTARVTPEAPFVHDVMVPFGVAVTTSAPTIPEVFYQSQWLNFAADATDTDGDGMSDAFEIAYGLNPSDAADAQADADGDGLSNLAEALKKSNPTLADTDADGVIDLFDDLPADPGETIDTDGDGIGNVEELDDDGDGVADDDDNCPLIRNSDQADSDGNGVGDACMDDVAPVIMLIGEATQSLRERDEYVEQGAVATDNLDGDISHRLVTTGAVDVNVPGTYVLRYNVADNAGNAASEVVRTVTVTADTRPVMRVYTLAEQIRALPNGRARVPVWFETSDGNALTSGIGFRSHFDARALSFQRYADRLAQDFFAADETGVSDAADFDDDASTDQYVSNAWSSLQRTWPGTAEPVQLVTLEFNVDTGALGAGTPVHFSVVDTDVDYRFEGTSVTILPPVAGSLDLDANGQVGPLSDGLIVLRHLFGFAGAALVDGAVAFDSPCQSEDVLAMQQCIDEVLQEQLPSLDVDGDGEVQALSDGLLIVRGLFGFSGAPLVDGAVSPTCTRCTADDIRSYLDALVPDAP